MTTKSGPFGLSMGFRIEDIGGEYQNPRLGAYTLSTVPKPHSSFAKYGVIISPSYGLHMINAIGHSISCDCYGVEVRTAFEDMLKRLTTVYGKHALTDKLIATDDYNESNWLQSIIDGKRFLFALWGFEHGSTLKDFIKSIFVDVAPYESYSASINVQYVFENYDEAHNELIHLEDDFL